MLALRGRGQEGLAVARGSPCSLKSFCFPIPKSRLQSSSFNLKLYFEDSEGSPEGWHSPDLIPKPSPQTDGVREGAIEVAATDHKLPGVLFRANGNKQKGESPTNSGTSYYSQANHYLPKPLTFLLKGGLALWHHAICSENPQPQEPEVVSTLFSALLPVWNCQQFSPI